MRSRLLAGWGALLVALAVALLVPRLAVAAEPPARVSVLTMGPGDHPFTRFGHNAILLEWDGGGARRSLVYNFGTFAFDGLSGVRDFMQGRFRYWLSVSSLDSTLRSYGAARRSLTAQELELTAAERAELADSLADNALPANRYYDYDYYRDNCSTRVRDAVDRILGGQLRREVAGPGRRTFRQHTLDMAATSTWLYLGLDLALGSGTDRPTTRWEELFLPAELRRELGRATRSLEAGDVPLVRSERILLEGQPRPTPSSSPARTRLFFATLLGGLLAVLGLGAARFRGLQIAFGISTAVLGGVMGLLGAALSIFSLSKHWAAHQNPSLLGCPPWALALAVLGLLFVSRRPSIGRTLLAILGASLVSSGVLVALGLHRMGVDSIVATAPFVSIWGGWFSGAWHATRSRQG
jgi:hypothetical protein